MFTQDIYIFSNGILYRNQNNLVFQNEEITNEWPIHKIRSIRVYGNITITTKLLKYLMNRGIDIYFYTKLGVYLGHTNSLHNKGNAQTLINQTKAYLYNRAYISKELTLGVIASMIYSIKTINYIPKAYNKIKEIYLELLSTNIENKDQYLYFLREYEARAWKEYYRYYNYILQNMRFIKRSYNPPEDEINTTISFINSLIYGTINAILRELYLNETISYVHEPMEKRASLVLDLADLFKPYIQLRILKFADKHIYGRKNAYIKKKNATYLSLQTQKEIALKYSNIMLETKETLWGKQLKSTIHTYIKNEITRFRDALNIENGRHYEHFLKNWVATQIGGRTND